MKRIAPKISLLLGYAISSIVLAMYCDISYRPTGWILGIYLLCPALHGILCRTAIRGRAAYLVILGNLLGACTNYGLWLLLQTEKWDPYFKWRPSSGRMFAFLAISFAIQLWFVFYDYAKRNWKNHNAMLYHRSKIHKRKRVIPSQSEDWLGMTRFVFYSGKLSLARHICI